MQTVTLNWHPMAYGNEFKALIKMIVENKLNLKETIGNPTFPCLKTIRRARMTKNLGLNLPQMVCENKTAQLKV